MRATPRVFVSAMRRLTLLLTLFLLPYGQAFALPIVLRDSIGPDSSLTDGMPGGGTIHDGNVWSMPGLVFEVPENGNCCSDTKTGS